MFELKVTTECELTRFVGRTQKAGKEDVPAVSIYLKISNASNRILDMLSPTMRLMAYAPVEGQEQLPGVELTTPVLRSPDLKHWKAETVHEGWRLFISRGIGDEQGLQMGSCKVDEFTFDLYQGGHVDCEFRISTGDVDEEGAGMLWGRQKRKVFVQLHAPEMPAAGATEATGAAIDGSVAAFKSDHPELFDGADGPTPEDALAHAVEGDQLQGDPDEHDDDTTDGAGDDTEGGATDSAAAAAEAAELEAGMSAAIASAGVKPARRGRRVPVGAVE